MTLAEQRENGRRSYELAIAMLRWNKLAAAYSLARQARRGQRKAWRELRSHTSWMMEAEL